MATTRYLVVVYVVTGGLHGEDLGSDEEEIVLFTWLVVDIANCKVVAVHSKVIKPRSADVNENILSETARNQFGLTEEQIKSGQCLESVIDEFDQYARGKLQSETGQSFYLITEGQYHLRQVIHPEAYKKNVTLPDYFNSFYDLRKEFRKFYRNNDITSIEEMLNYLNIEADGSAECAIQKIQNMAKIIIRLINDGHKFEEPETINLRLEPGILGANEFVDDNTVVRARGLPWQLSDQDIANFFRGLNVYKGGVALCLSLFGRRNGEALVRFVNQEHRDMALKRHKHHIRQRYIEVYRAFGDDFLRVAGGNNNEAQQFLSKGAQVIVRMRGLPYECTAQQIIDFFASNDSKCEVLKGDEGILFVRKLDGRATGDAFVLFETEEMGNKALQKHRKMIGTRYIEIFRSSTAEVQQVLNRTMMDQIQPNLPIFQANMPLVQQLHAPARKDCIRLRGLPYEAQVEQILDFLSEHAKNIALHGVHMVFNAQGQPSGEAFIQMKSDDAAFNAASERHHKFMTIGKKQRYIEVFQCSMDDMNLIGPAPRTIISPGGSLLPPPPPTPQMAPATFGAYPFIQNQVLPAATVPSPATAITSAGARIPTPFYHPVFYWPYVSPPVSPTTYYPDSGAPMFTPELLQIQRNNNMRINGEHMINFVPRIDEERIKDRQALTNPYVEMFMV